MTGTAAKVGPVLQAREFSLGFAEWEMSLCHSGSVSSGQLSKKITWGFSRDSDREGCGVNFVKLALAFKTHSYMIIILHIYITVINTRDSLTQ